MATLACSGAGSGARTTQGTEGWSSRIRLRQDQQGLVREIDCERAEIPAACSFVARTLGEVFAGLVIEQGCEWSVRYLFHSAGEPPGWTCVLARAPLAEGCFPSISGILHAADWHEREAEDLFGLLFEGHPRLGDFVLHDEVWPEGLAPMRRDPDAQPAPSPRAPGAPWRPDRIVHAPGAMPVGPVYSATAESAHFLLETVGEDVIRAVPRLFYKYRAVEKIAEGRPADDALLLAERINGLTAFAHALAYAQALEAIRGVDVPARARALRIFFAELERLRHHVGAIAEICESTALAIATSQAAMLEEELLRLSAVLAGHRYLFGLLACGGLARDWVASELSGAVTHAHGIVQQLNALETRLLNTSSFLDRLEEVGVVTTEEALMHGLVGPIARASGVARDLRRIQPYCGYDSHPFKAPVETEGDGYARLRILFAESRQCLQLMAQAARDDRQRRAPRGSGPRLGGGTARSRAPLAADR
jgi:Ni,Fe-hydrogenase III large subunit